VSRDYPIQLEMSNLNDSYRAGSIDSANLQKFILEYFRYLSLAMMRKVEVVPHDPNWRDEFAIESARVVTALGNNITAIHHIGSTSIATIHAKPIIDMLVEVSSIDRVDDRNSHMQALGYECMGEFGIPGRRFFRKNNAAGIRTHHIHTFATNSAQVKRHLAFRDYLNAYPEAARAYSELKQQLAQQYPTDIEGYMDGKAAFIHTIDLQAAEWRVF
jgi:GrpB-like predicted nucleotidyltransferase (UPF0157 family)